MFILIFLPVYLSFSVVVVFKILVISVSNMDDSAPNLVFKVDNQGQFVWQYGDVHLFRGKGVRVLPEIFGPRKINLKLMNY